MSIYDRCLDLQLKLEAAQSADTSLELLARAARLVDGLDRASEYFIGATAFRSKAGISDAPGLDMKAMSQAVGAFRAGLSRHGTAAFQHQPATTLTDVAKSQRERVVRWVAAQWKKLFAEYDLLLERAQNEHLVGSGTQRLVAQARASRLRTARGIDPVAQSDELKGLLGGEDLTVWTRSIKALGDELRRALEALDDERAALTPEVRHALQQAASDVGLPLTEVSPELLAALRAAGVDEHLLVRRR